MSNEQQLRQWMQEAQEGNQASYRQILYELYHISCKTLYSRVKQSEDVEDIAQEIVISVDKALHSYNPAKPLMPWFMAIVNFRFKDYLRKIYRHKDFTEIPYDEFAESINPTDDENVTDLGVRGEYLEEALQQLPEKQQKIIRYMYVEGFSVKEVALSMDMSVSAVKVTAHRVYKKLRKEIEDKEQHDAIN